MVCVLHYKQINDIRPFRIDAPVYIRARIVSATRSFIHISVEAWAETRDKLAVTGSLPFYANRTFV